MGHYSYQTKNVKETIMNFLPYFLLSRAMTCISVSVPKGSPSRGGDVAVYVFDINQLSLPTPFYSVLVPVSVLQSFHLDFIP